MFFPSFKDRAFLSSLVSFVTLSKGFNLWFTKAVARAGKPTSSARKYKRIRKKTHNVTVHGFRIPSNTGRLRTFCGCLGKILGA